jgi:hypothetical protein
MFAGRIAGEKEGKMLNDASDHDWELAMLVYEQSRLVSKKGTLTPEEENLYRMQARRIEQLLDELADGIPTWQRHMGEGSERMWQN